MKWTVTPVCFAAEAEGPEEGKWPAQLRQKRGVKIEETVPGYGQHILRDTLGKTGDDGHIRVERL